MTPLALETLEAHRKQCGGTEVTVVEEKDDKIVLASIYQCHKCKKSIRIEHEEPKLKKAV